MTFHRLFDIVLRSMVLNAWLFAILLMVSLPINGDVFFFNNSECAARGIIFLTVMNCFHWTAEVLSMFIKTKPDEDFE